MFKRNQKVELFLLILLIFLFTATPRLMSINDGLPYLHYYDEPLIINGAINGLKRMTDGDSQTNFLPVSSEVVYGGLMRYTCMLEDAFYFLYLKLSDPDVNSFSDIKTDLSGDQPLTISHPGFFYWNRIYHVVLSVASFIFMFLIARLRLGTLNGLISVLILASIGTYYAWSYIVNSNIPLSTWTIATLYFAIRYNHSKQYKHLILSLVFTGLAMSTKMTGLAVLLIPAIVALLNYDILKKAKPSATFWKAMYLVLIPLGIFVLFNPSVYLNTNHFIYWINWLRATYISGIGNLHKQPGLEHFSFQIINFKNNLGILFFYLSIAGILIGLIRLKFIKKTKINPFLSDILIIVIFPIIYLVFVTSQYSVAYHRNFLLFYPILSLMAAEAITLIVRYALNISSKLKPFASWVLSTILIVITWQNLPKYQAIFNNAENVHASLDTRSKTINYLNDLSGNEKMYLGIESGLKISLYDLKKFKQSFGFFDIKNIDLAMLGFTHLILPDYLFTSGDFVAFPPDTIKALNNAISDRQIFEFKGSKINYYHDLVPWDPIANPTVKIITGSDYPPPQMEKYSTTILYKPTINLIDHRPVKIYEGVLSNGYYDLLFEASGMEAMEEFPAMDLLINDEIVGSIITSTKDFVATKISFKIKIRGKLKIYLRMTNDYWNEETKQDRNLFLRNIELRDRKI